MVAPVRAADTTSSAPAISPEKSLDELRVAYDRYKQAPPSQASACTRAVEQGAQQVRG